MDICFDDKSTSQQAKMKQPSSTECVQKFHAASTSSSGSGNKNCKTIHAFPFCENECSDSTLSSSSQSPLCSSLHKPLCPLIVERLCFMLPMLVKFVTMSVQLFPMSLHCSCGCFTFWCIGPLHNALKQLSSMLLLCFEAAETARKR